VRRRKDGGLIDISLTVSPLADATGTIVGASKIARDITDKKRAQTRQELLLREMGHRVKNAFTLVNGIVGLSARYAKPKNLVTDIQARLAALARAHDLTRPGLLSAESQETQSMPFRALIDAIFAPYLDSNMSGNFQRLTVVGPDLLVHQTSITSLALVLYELATNAVKCGSLSLPAGRVQITLSLVDDRFELEWRERGGPKLTEAPNHEGFGTNLVRRVVAEQFRGEVVYDWNAEGLVVRLMTPSHQVLNVSKVETSA
jgi:two-component sensor histidine kinase